MDNNLNSYLQHYYKDKNKQVLQNKNVNIEKELIMTKRVYNFSAGPAILPVDVLQAAADEMLNFNNSGMGVMELSHRSTWYQEVIDSAEAGLRKLMNIPSNYKVLFLQGGASMQFAMIPMNLMKNKKADYVNTGAWSKKAIKEAKRFGDVKVVGDSSDTTFSYFP